MGVFYNNMGISDNARADHSLNQRDNTLPSASTGD
jgi:hypothetical protein